MSNRNRRSQTQRRESVQRAAGQGTGFVFHHKGKQYTLPSAKESVTRIPAGVLIDAVMDGDEMAELRLGLATLEASGASKAVIDALREKPFAEFGQILSRWMQSNGAPMGKSE